MVYFRWSALIFPFVVSLNSLDAFAKSEHGIYVLPEIAT